MDLATYLTNLRDPAGVPFYPVVFQGLLVLTFALHILFVNFVVGGAALALWGRLSGGANARRLSGVLARATTVNLSLAIVLGVAPLLFVQVIYDPFWYTANTMSAWWALGFLAAVILAFYFAYAFYLGGKKRNEGGLVLWSLLCLAALFVAGGIIHGLSVEQLQPENWKAWLVHGLELDTSGTGLYAFRAPRILHFLAPSFAITGVYLMAYAWYFKGRADYEESYLDWVARLGANIALIATAFQAAIGLWWVLTLPRTLNFFLNPAFLVGAGGGIGLLVYFALIRTQPVRYAPLSLGLSFLVILLMSSAREALRMAYVGQFQYSIYDYKLNLDWGSTLLFLFTFVGGLVVIAYPLAVAYHTGKRSQA